MRAKKIICSLLTFATIVSGLNYGIINVYAAEVDSNTGIVESQKSTNPLDYKENTKERYIASIAYHDGISYEQALAMYEKEESVEPRIQDEFKRYKTVDKYAGYIETTGKDYNVHIATEVAYIYNRNSSRAVKIESVGGPYSYISEGANGSLNGGDFNIEKINSLSYRISKTGSFTFTTTTSVQVGCDIISVYVGSDYICTTKAKTFKINITQGDL